MNILFAVGCIGMISLILLPFRLTFNEWFGISCLLGYFYAKSVINKTDLENKIFELKGLLEKRKEL